MFKVFFDVPLDHAAPTMRKVKNCILMFIARYGVNNENNLLLAIPLEILPDILTSSLSLLINLLTTFCYHYPNQPRGTDLGMLVVLFHEGEDKTRQTT